MMRHTYQQGDGALMLESLEHQRQHIGAYTAYAAAVRDGHYPEAIEQASPDEAQAPL